MGKLLFVGANVAFIIVFGLIAEAFGSDNPPLQFPTTILSPSSGSFWDKVIAPFVWARDAIGVFIQLIGYAFTGAHPIVTAVVFAPLIMIDFGLVYGMVRGGGT